MYNVMKVKTCELIPFIQTLLKEDSAVCIPVTGMSMYPFLRDALDSVELASTSFDKVKPGTIVLAKRVSGDYVMHRICRKTLDAFYLQGDAQCWVEGPFHSEQLIAKVHTVWRIHQKISCNSFGWRMLSAIWMRLQFCRKPMIRAIRKIGRDFSKLNRAD